MNEEAWNTIYETRMFLMGLRPGSEALEHQVDDLAAKLHKISSIFVDLGDGAFVRRDKILGFASLDKHHCNVWIEGFTLRANIPASELAAILGA